MKLIQIHLFESKNDKMECNRLGCTPFYIIVRPACIQSKRCKSSARPIAGSAQPKARVSVARLNLKEVGGKRLA